MPITNLDWTNVMLSVGSILLAGGFTMLIKNILRKYRRPNGKKGGILSLHTAVAFAVVTVIAMTTKDWFLTGLAVILAYLIARGRMDEGQHYLYQIVITSIIGVAIPYALFYFYHKNMTVHADSDSSRDEYTDKPTRANDDRHEADQHTELKLSDDDLEL